MLKIPIVKEGKKDIKVLIRMNLLFIDKEQYIEVFYIGIVL